MTTAIRIESVSKLYRLGTVGTGTIAHDLNRWWHQIRGKEDPYAKIGQVNDRTKAAKGEEQRAEGDASDPSLGSPPSALRSRASGPDYVWALRDINLEVQQGEVLGIIGRNGAGKSTLLKLLSRVTAPTTGSIKTKGRIASLLEVGTGFHPELTGRENIFLNGAILGMKRYEIAGQLDEIVDFSGCAKYVDTPVKRYSSGMMVRLGFAVAAYLRSEILIIDEVLAVGDSEFQKSCVAKMRSIHHQGRTILVVSHNMYVVRSICQRGVALTVGTITDDGDVNSVADRYLAETGVRQMEVNEKVATSIMEILSVQIRSVESTVIRTFDKVEIIISVLTRTSVVDPGIYLGFLNQDGVRLCGLDFKDFASTGPLNVGTRTSFIFTVDNFPLLAGRYSIEVHTKDMATALYEYVSTTYPFDVVETPVYGMRKLDAWFGNVALMARVTAIKH